MKYQYTMKPITTICIVHNIWNLFKPKLIGTNICVHNRQVFGLSKFI
jgi:hypothetical protein